MKNTLHSHADQPLQFIAWGSIAIAIAVLGLKYVAYILTGSVALYSDALESIVNVVTAIAALLAVRLSARPASQNLPYGYHKVEYFSAVMIGVLIILAALSILHAAYKDFINPKPLLSAYEGLAVSAVAGLINGFWCWFLLKKSQQLRSFALKADARHLLTDVISSFAVVFGVFIVAATGLEVLDPALATFVAINILWSGWKLISESIGGLMDVSVGSQMLERIREIIALNAKGAIEAHDILTRQAGRAVFIEFHLVVPGKMPVDEAHEICDQIEDKLKEEIPHTHITIHLEPDNKAKHTGIIVI